MSAVLGYVAVHALYVQPTHPFSQVGDWIGLRLLDIGMPRLNGYDVCRRMRTEPWGAGALIVAVTGWGQESDKRRASEAGFDLHLTKPMDPAALAELLAASTPARVSAAR